RSCSRHPLCASRQRSGGRRRSLAGRPRRTGAHCAGRPGVGPQPIHLSPPTAGAVSGHSGGTRMSRPQRVAILLNDVPRPETTGTYCLRALRELAEVEHFRPGEVDYIPRDRFDLYLAIDDGLNYPIPDGLHPSAYWAIDTHIDFAAALAKSRQFDL